MVIPAVHSLLERPALILGSGVDRELAHCFPPPPLLCTVTFSAPFLLSTRWGIPFHKAKVAKDPEAEEHSGSHGHPHKGDRMATDSQEGHPQCPTVIEWKMLKGEERLATTRKDLRNGFTPKSGR